MTPSVRPMTPPFVGRASELAVLAAALDGAERGRAATVFVAGEGGIGKTRLVTATAELATGRGWTTALGRAYPVETGVPYALFTDALAPLLNALDASALATLTRGGGDQLVPLFPSLAARGAIGAVRPLRDGGAAEHKARLLWTIAQLLAQLSRRHPLLLVLENVQWADASSLELLHFASRQSRDARLVVLCTYNEAERGSNEALCQTERSLLSLEVATRLPLAPLDRAATQELIDRMFGAERHMTVEFTALLYGWTRGNPFFLEETLKTLVETGRLYERDGTWLGWELDALELPRTVREALIARLDRLSPGARALGDLAAVLGTRVTYAALRAVSGSGESELLPALDDLRRRHILNESAEGEAIVYDFTHPMLRDVLYAELGMARARALHATVAEALEQFYGTAALAHADELAFHYVRGDPSTGFKAVKYLIAAGRAARAAYANREAADYLTAALVALDARPRDGAAADPLADDAPSPSLVAEELAQVRQRLGDYAGALALWERTRADADAAGDLLRLASVRRQMGLAAYWSGRYAEAIAQYDAGLSVALDVDSVIASRLRIAKALCLQALGDAPGAKREAESALATAQQREDAPLLARVHRTLLLLYTHTGPADVARAHGAQAIAFSAAAGARGLAWAAHAALAVLEAFTSHAPALAAHLAESERLADELHSPLLKLWTAEVAIEYDAGRGAWDAALARGERSVALARALGQRTLVPRLLVWTGLVYLGRGDRDRAHRYLTEAWSLSGADRPPGGPTDVHAVVTAHTGLTHYHVVTGDYHRAIEVGEAGLAIADRSGYAVWAVYRLLPMITEAALWQRDVALAQRLGGRLRRESERLDHRLGVAWADCCDGLIAMLRRDHASAIELLRAAAESLDGVPFIYDAARVRRKLAWVLWKSGNAEAARRELRRAHDVFDRLGAAPELTVTRTLLRAFGARPPVRHGGRSADGLTDREVGIVRLVAAHKSNKEIGASLGISSRTVSTHLSNIFTKMAVSSRSELAELARRRGLAAH